MAPGWLIGSRRIATTSSIPGRRTGSSFQQRFVISQTESVKSRSCGRSGRLPSRTAKAATVPVKLLKGHLPVNTLSRVS